MPISFALSHSGHITAWSADAAASFGRPADEVLGQDWRSLFTDGARDTLHAAMSNAAAGKHYSGVVTVALGDDTHREGLLTCSPLMETDGGTGLLCQVTDLAEASRQEGQTAFVDALMRASPFGLGMIDNELRYVFVNDALAEFNGVPAKDHIGRRVGELVSAADDGEYEKHLRSVLESGEPLSNVLIGSRSRGQRDRDKAWSVSFFRLTGRDGEVLGLGGLVVEVTDRETALLEASAFRHRLSLVNQATSRLGTTLEMGETARELAEFVVPDFVDAASVDIRRDFLDGGRLPVGEKRVTTVRLAGRSLLESAADRMLFSDSGTEHVHEAGSRTHRSLCTGRPWRSDRLDEGALAELAQQEGEAGLLQESGLGSVIVAPLVARGRSLGLVQIARSAEREPLNEEDVQVAEEVVARAALSLDNARLYDEERRVAVALQRNMLPDGKDIPRRPGLEIAYHYRASSRSAQVGGDWFDIIPLSGHRIALVVGDMMGHDIQAAAGMGQMRTAMHTLARLDLEPVDLLSRLDKIVEISPAMQYATCVYAVYNTVTRECGIANAGHPAPVLWRPDRTTEMVPVGTGVPLGLGLGSSEFTLVNMVLPEDSTLVLYTDGLIERRNQDIDVGLDAMRDVLAASELAGPSVQEMCDDVVAKLKEPLAHDDLAVLMARAPAMPGHRSARWRIPPDPRSASRVRSMLRRELRAWQLEDLEDTAQLLTSELITNALGHAHGEIELQVAKGGSLVVEVTDADERLPHRRTQVSLEDDGGRGLTLVGECAKEWGARSVPGGKVVWFELPLPGGEGSGTETDTRERFPRRRVWSYAWGK